MEFDTYAVDEGATVEEMQGPSSRVNQLAGRDSWRSSPTKSLVMLWFVILGMYWFLGWLFKGARGK